MSLLTSSLFSLLLIGLCLYGTTEAFVLDSPDGPVGATALPILAQPPLRIAAFNIQIFGVNKYSNVFVRNSLFKILSRYDIVDIMEIRDISNTVLENLRVDINQYMKSQGITDHFEKVESARLGRTSSKEQYGFLYRPSRVTVTGSRQFQDTHDLFEREPFGVFFHCPSTTLTDFVIMAIHISPSKAVAEISNLAVVYEDFKTHWNTNDILIAGDFNADCSYLPNSAWANVTLKHDARFTWLIGDNEDTTVSSSDCSYDRFVASGTKLPSAIVPDSIKVYRFDEVMGLTKDQGLDISDHYPIELELQGRPNDEVQRTIQTSTTFTVTDSQPVSNINDIRKVYRLPSCAPAQFTVKLEREETHMDYVSATVTHVADINISKELAQLSSSCSGILSSNLRSTVDAFVKSNFLQSNVPNIYGLVTSLSSSYDVKVTCNIVTPHTCSVSVTRRISGK